MEWSRCSRLVVTTTILVLGWLAGCGGIASAPARPRVADCASGWATTVVVKAAEEFTMPRTMAWADGVLYQAAWSAILATPADGGVQQTLVANIHPEGIWVEGDYVLYSVLNQLMQIPRKGGLPTLILDGGLAPDPTAPSGQTPLVADQRILDPGYFYWTSVPYNGQGGTIVSRMPRSGGTAEVLFQLPIIDVYGMAATADGVLAAGFTGEGFSTVIAPFDGGLVRSIPILSGASLLTVDSTGAVWRTPSDIGIYELSRVSPDGASLPFQDLPKNVLWDWARSDENGGYFLSGTESFDDDAYHRSVFWETADGSAIRLACDTTMSFSGIRGTALAPEVLYLTINRFGQDWSIVRIPRTSQRP